MPEFEWQEEKNWPTTTWEAIDADLLIVGRVEQFKDEQQYSVFDTRCRPQVFIGMYTTLQAAKRAVERLK